MTLPSQPAPYHQRKVKVFITEMPEAFSEDLKTRLRTIFENWTTDVTGLSYGQTLVIDESGQNAHQLVNDTTSAIFEIPEDAQFSVNRALWDWFQTTLNGGFGNDFSKKGLGVQLLELSQDDQTVICAWSQGDLVFDSTGAQPQYQGSQLVYNIALQRGDGIHFNCSPSNTEGAQLWYDNYRAVPEPSPEPETPATGPQPGEVDNQL